MSLSKLLHSYKNMTVSIQCSNFKEKCIVMGWCNQAKNNDWKEIFFKEDHKNTVHLGIKLWISNHCLNDSGHFSYGTDADLQYTFKEFCTKWVDKPINSSINDNYELI